MQLLGLQIITKTMHSLLSVDWPMSSILRDGIAIGRVVRRKQCCTCWTPTLLKTANMPA